MTQLPNPFLNSTVSPRAVGSAVASNPTPAADATAAPKSALASAMTADTAAGPEFADPPVPAAVAIYEPPSNEGRHQETPASAPSKNPDVGVLGKCNCAYSHCDDFDRPDCKAKAAGLDPWPDAPTNHIHEIFAGARKLYPPIDIEEIELPLFIRDGDHLRRWEA